MFVPRILDPVSLEVKCFLLRGVKITRGPWALGPYLGGRAPRSPSLGARQAPRNVRGQNREN